MDDLLQLYLLRKMMESAGDERSTDAETAAGNKCVTRGRCLCGGRVRFGLVDPTETLLNYFSEESKSEKPDEKGVLQTLSKQVTGPMEHSPVRVVIQWHIKEFASMMSSYEPGKSLWSEGVPSKREKGAVWKLRLYPNGNNELKRGVVSFYLHLTGPMADKKESLRASYHIYTDSDDGMKGSILRDTDTFKDDYHWGCGVRHEEVKKKALRKDGSLMVTAEVEFLAPKLDSCSSCSG